MPGGVEEDTEALGRGLMLVLDRAESQDCALPLVEVGNGEVQVHLLGMVLAGPLRGPETLHLLEGDGRATVYAGGWTDYQTQRGLVLAEIAAEEARAAQGAAQSAAVKAAKVEKASAKPAGKALSFTEKHRLEALPEVIAKLEAEIVKLTEFLSAPDLFAKEPAKFKKGTEALVERQEALAKAEEEWLALEERAAV